MEEAKFCNGTIKQQLDQMLHKGKPQFYENNLDLYFLESYFHKIVLRFASALRVGHSATERFSRMLPGVIISITEVLTKSNNVVTIQPNFHFDDALYFWPIIGVRDSRLSGKVSFLCGAQAEMRLVK